MSASGESKVYKANYMLQSKIGSGPIDAEIVEQAQKVMDENTVDFAPLAKEFLDKLQQAVEHARGGEQSMDEMIAEMTGPVMQLKANAGTFNYDLIGNLANIMLSFLEGIKEMDKNAIEIVAAHHTTLTAIVNNKMKGDGGDYGRQMEQELKDACKRYFASKK